MGGSGDGGECVELVVCACDSPLHLRYGLALVQHGKVVRRTLRGIVAHRAAKGLRLAPAAKVQHAGNAFF